MIGKATKALGLVLALSIGSITSVMAGDHTTNDKYEVERLIADFEMSIGEIDSARKRLESLVEAGDPESFFRYGSLLVFGNNGAEKDKGIEYLKKAADANIPEAVLILSTIIAENKSDEEVWKDPEWFELARKGSELRSPELSVAFAYNALFENDERHSVEDRNKAWESVLEVAETGFVPAITLVADAYWQGKHVDADPDEASRWYMRAVSAGDVGAANNVAYLWAENDMKLEEAEKLSAIAVAKEPDNAAFLDTYGWILVKKEKFDMAVTFLEEAVKLEPDSWELSYHLGYAYGKNAQYSKSLEYLEKSLELLSVEQVEERKMIETEIENISLQGPI